MESNWHNFFVNLGHLLSFSTTNNLKNQKLIKMKKTPGDNIILKLCTTNVWFLRYGVQQTEYFGLLFALLRPQQPGKSKFWKNDKMPGDLSFYKCTINENHDV